MEEKVDQIDKPDRMLGDEWESWTGDLDESVIYNESAALFARFTALSLVTISALVALALYMIEPRLSQIHPSLVIAARIVIGLVILIFTGWVGLIISSAFTGKNLIGNSRMGQVTAARLMPWTVAVARRLGISRDRIGNSFVTFSNAIVKATYTPGKGKTIILLPRCLNVDVKKEIKELGEKANVKVFTATGGGQARKIIRAQRPSSVIGVACERDLMSGIQDVAPKMPTIGVTNKRPDGPCKNTRVDMDELREAIKSLTGVELNEKA